MEREIKLGKTYQHFKGGYYQAELLAKHTETDETLVIYRSLNSLDYFARPLSMFLGEVDAEKYPDAKQRYRMELVD